MKKLVKSKNDGKRILAIGVSGGGKSSLIKEYLIKETCNFDYVFIADSCGEFMPWIEFDEKIHVLEVDDKNLFTLTSRLKMIWTRAKNYYKEHLEPEKKTLIIIDELDTYNECKQVKDIIYAFCNWGRKYGISLIAGVRSPFYMEKSMLRQAGEFWVFNLVDPGDISQLYFKKDFKQIENLKPGEYIIYKR